MLFVNVILTCTVLLVGVLSTRYNTSVFISVCVKITPE